MIFNGKTMTAFVTFTPAAVDDSAVGENKLWSSKNTVDKLCPAINETGRVVRCEPVEGYPLQVVSYWEASDSEHNSVTLTHCGKNLYNKDAFPLSAGMINKNTGAVTGGSKCGRTDSFIPIAHLRGQTITLNHPATNTYATAGTAFYDEDQIYINGTSEPTMVVPDNAAYMRFSVPVAYKDGSQIQIELGDTVTDFEPYAGETWTAEEVGASAGQSGRFNWADGYLYEEEGERLIIDEPPAILGKAGCNILFSDTGETAVVGRADPAKKISQLEAEMVSVLGRITELELGITFFIGEAAYKTTRGKTWAEFAAEYPVQTCDGCGESYHAFLISDGNVYIAFDCGDVETCSGSMGYILFSEAEGVEIHADDVIVENGRYYY